MTTLTTTELVYRLLAAVVCGAVIGLNRDLHRKAAGFRTFSLVSLGSGLVALIIVQFAPGEPDAMSRVIQGVLTGIGFLGAGVILHEETARQVSGLTTAAAIWLSAGLGMACGAGLYVLALLSLGLALCILLIGRRVEKVSEAFFSRTRSADKPTDPDERQRDGEATNGDSRKDPDNDDH